jgi:hypothetical protein
MAVSELRNSATAARRAASAPEGMVNQGDMAPD